MIQKLLLLNLLLAFTTFGLPSVNEILAKIDERHRMKTDIKSNVTMTQQKPDQGARKFQMVYYRRDSDNSFLITFSAPEAENGNGYLRMGDNFWMYRKNTRTFQHIGRDENIGGTDAKGSNFEERRLTELYAPIIDNSGKEKISEEMLGKIPVYRFECKAKVKDVDYPLKTYWVRRNDFVLLKEASYAVSGTLMLTGYYLKFTEIKGSTIAVQMMFVDEFEKGNKTIVEISGISTDKLDDKIFTKAYLENLSK